MKIVEAVFKFKDYVFSFKQVDTHKQHGRTYKKWEVTVDYRNKKYVTHYLAFVPSAHICRRIKKNGYFLKNRIKS